MRPVTLIRGVVIAITFAVPAPCVQAESVEDALTQHILKLQSSAENLKLQLWAENGDVEAQISLGYRYANGLIMPQDYVESAKWYRLAAEQGHAKGQFELGLLYRTGDGVPKDAALAYMWFNLAAAQGYEFAGINRDNLAQFMTPEQVAEAQRLAREWKPKE